MIFQKWISRIYRLQKNLEFTQKFPNGIFFNFGSFVQDDVAQEKEIIEAETEQNKEVFGKDNYFFQFWFNYQNCYSKSIFNVKNLLNHLFMIFVLV